MDNKENIEPLNQESIGPRNQNINQTFNVEEEKVTKLWIFWSFISLAVIFVGLLGYWGITSWSKNRSVELTAIKEEQSVKPEDNQTGQTSKFLIVATKDCRDLAERIKIEKVVAKTATELMVIANLTDREAVAIKNQSCVTKVTNDRDEAQNLINGAQSTLETETERDIRQNKLEKSVLSKDIQNKEALIKYLKEKHGEQPVMPDQLSNYQSYVTPVDQTVSKIYQKFGGFESIYNYGANNWVWVSDQTLYGQAENWVLPNYFLTQTPYLPSNPLSNHIAGDCEDQANALASAIRADGQSAANVRTVLGLVNFNGQVGGYAWVEIYQGHVAQLKFQYTSNKIVLS